MVIRVFLGIDVQSWIVELEERCLSRDLPNAAASTAQDRLGLRNRLERCRSVRHARVDVLPMRLEVMNDVRGRIVEHGDVTGLVDVLPVRARDEIVVLAKNLWRD